jgi:hypothetical protein
VKKLIAKSQIPSSVHTWPRDMSSWPALYWAFLVYIWKSSCCIKKKIKVFQIKKKNPASLEKSELLAALGITVLCGIDA